MVPNPTWHRWRETQLADRSKQYPVDQLQRCDDITGGIGLGSVAARLAGEPPAEEVILGEIAGAEQHG